MSSTNEPDYVRRRKDRDQKEQTANSASGDRKKWGDIVVSLRAALKEIIRSRAAQESANAKKNAEENKLAAPTWLGAKAAIVAVIVAAISVAAFIYVSLQTDSTAQRALDISAQQLRETEAAQRAFIFYVENKVTPITYDDGRQAMLITPQWQNSGDTPSKNLMYEIYCGQDSSKFDFTKKGSFRYMLGPKQISSGGSCTLIPPSQFARKSGKIGSFFIGGKARYFNVFDTKHPRITEFCLNLPIVQAYSQTTGKLELRVGMDGIDYCPTHNCADDECPAEDRN